jgi:hypothetical protein
VARIKATAAEIRDLVAERVKGLPALKSAGAKVTLSMPQWHEPDEEGSNWDIAYFGGDAHLYAESIAVIVTAARDQYELVESR